MSEFKLPAYRLPEDSMTAVQDSVDAICIESRGSFEPQKHLPHLTLLRHSLFGGRVGIDVSTQHHALAEVIILQPEGYTLPVLGIENTTRNLNSTAILAIMLDDPSGIYDAEYSSIRSRIPERIRGKVVTNKPHITLGRLAPEHLCTELLARGEEKLPKEIDFGPLLFSTAVMNFHESA